MTFVCRPFLIHEDQFDRALRAAVAIGPAAEQIFECFLAVASHVSLVGQSALAEYMQSQIHIRRTILDQKNVYFACRHALPPIMDMVSILACAGGTRVK